MLDPYFEINKLRWKLQNRGYSYSDVDTISRQASDDIHAAILDVVSDASAEAVSYAESIGATDFFADIDVVPDGFAFAIKTRSGRTDYSIDRTENLTNLLKNAKTAADGSRYKVIPIKEKPKMGISSMANMQQQSDAAKIARAKLLESNRANISERASTIADQLRQSMAATIASNRERQEGDVKFKTASSKQEAHISWVIPEMDRDMTQYLHQLNDGIKVSIENSVLLIIARYDEEYA
jgi:hypothetical protein